jgi:hypothetical protein
MTYCVCQPHEQTDRQSILELWQRNLPGSSPKRYRWLYESGPASSLLLHAADGRAVGSIGLMRRTLLAQGRPLPAGQAIDLNVDGDHRTIGPALQLARAATAAITRGELSLIYGFPNRRSEAVFRRLGYRVLGELQRWVRPLSGRAVIQRSPWPRLLRGAAALVDPILWLQDLWLRGAGGRPGGTGGSPVLVGTAADGLRRRPLRFEATDRFDARFDRFWRRAAAPAAIVGERSAAYLTWRFGQSPAALHRTLCLLDARGELAAYLVYSRRAGAVSISDFLYAQAADFEILLAEFLRQMRHARADTVSATYLGHPAVGQTLARFGFWRRPSPGKAVLYADPNGPAAPPAGCDLFQPANWHLTRADLDTDE